MQVLVVVVDDNGKSETLQLERDRETKNYVKYKAGDMGKPIIGSAYVAKSLQTTEKS